MRCLILLSLIVAISSGAPLRAADVEAWQRTIDRVVADIEATHPEPYTKVSRAKLHGAAEKLKSELAALEEPARHARVLALVAMLGDGHTTVHLAAREHARWYPVRLHEFSDGYFITGAHRTVGNLAGAEVLSIGGVPVARAAAKARELIAGENEFHARERLFALHNATLMQGIGFARPNGALEIAVRRRDGRAETRVLEPMQGESATFDWTFQPEYWGAVGPPEDWISGFDGRTVAQLRELDVARPLHIRHRRAFYATAVPAIDAYYIQVNVVGGNAEESLPAFFRRALAEVDRLEPKRLVLDFRYNFGGDGSNVHAVVSQFIQRKESPPWSELYLLTGRRTFSAAVLMLAAFDDWVGPTIVGEPAGAPRNSFGDANSFDYPDLGLRLYVSAERHQTGKSSDRSTFIPVDYPAPFSAKDYFAGRDPAVDAILRGDELRGLTAIAASDGADVAARVHRDRLKRLAGDTSWQAPREIELRQVALELADRGELASAIEVARLNAELNPKEWRTHYNLGNLHLQAKDEDAAIESFRRSLALDDPTNFNAERLRAIVAEAEAKRGGKPATAVGSPPPRDAFSKPAVVRFGATTAELERELAPLCRTTKTRPIDPPFLPDVRVRQLQIDCDGLRFLGKPRWAEFVIRDDRLVMVWVMVDAVERDGILAKMRAAHGQPTGENTQYVAFADARTAWRHEPAEVLFYGPELDATAARWFARR